ncbi:MAG: crossover junction endodeoxyribonuclease RuvC [Patescibacteria group bacterium]
MRNSKDIIILGVDPGLAKTGFGLICCSAGKEQLIDYGCIETSQKTELARRLLEIHQRLGSIIAEHQPDFLAVEDLFFAKNAKSALKVGQACGVIALTGSLAGLPVLTFTPLEIKQALAAYGRAGKDQVQKMVRILLNLKEIPQPDHAADALAAAICASRSIKLSECLNKQK